MSDAEQGPVYFPDSLEVLTVRRENGDLCVGLRADYHDPWLGLSVGTAKQVITALEKHITLIENAPGKSR